MRIRVIPAALIGLSAVVALGSVTLRSQAAATRVAQGRASSSNPTFSETDRADRLRQLRDLPSPGEVGAVLAHHLRRRRRSAAS